jgi:hypothetical protein
MYVDSVTKNEKQKALTLHRTSPKTQSCVARVTNEAAIQRSAMSTSTRAKFARRRFIDERIAGF